MDTSTFIFNNNTWHCVFSVPLPITVWVKGEASFFDDAHNVKNLEILVNGISEQVNQAVNFAKYSEYAGEVADAGGLALDSVYVDRWDDIRIWFSLINDAHRLIGVRLIDSRPVDVYCDN